LAASRGFQGDSPNWRKPVLTRMPDCRYKQRTTRITIATE